MATKSELPPPVKPPGVTIPPTVGRIVWFFTTVDLGWGEHIEGSNKPRAAIVANADHPDVINLCVFDYNGVPRPMTSVQLVQDGDKPADGEVYWCEWMPYQKGQAAKVEAMQDGKPLEGRPDWPPAGSAHDVPNGTKRRGSTGQLFQAIGGQWVRLSESGGQRADPISRDLGHTEGGFISGGQGNADPNTND